MESRAKKKATPKHTHTVFIYLRIYCICTHHSIHVTHVCQFKIINFKLQILNFKHLSAHALIKIRKYPIWFPKHMKPSWYGYTIWASHLTGFCAGNPLGTSGFPHKVLIMWKMYPSHDVNVEQKWKSMRSETSCDKKIHNNYKAEQIWTDYAQVYSIHNLVIWSANLIMIPVGLIA